MSPLYFVLVIGIPVALSSVALFVMVISDVAESWMDRRDRRAERKQEASK
jgi:uncharacterized membrane protein YccF (DUF307 family)